MTDSLNGRSLRDELGEAIANMEDGAVSCEQIADACLAVMAGRWNLPQSTIEQMEFAGSSNFNGRLALVTFRLPPTAKEENHG